MKHEIESLNSELFENLSVEELEKRLEMEEPCICACGINYGDCGKEIE